MDLPSSKPLHQASIPAKGSPSASPFSEEEGNRAPGNGNVGIVSPGVVRAERD